MRSCLHLVRSSLMWSAAVTNSIILKKFSDGWNAVGHGWTSLTTSEFLSPAQKLCGELCGGGVHPGITVDIRNSHYRKLVPSRNCSAGMALGVRSRLYGSGYDPIPDLPMTINAA